jgi:iron complex transport system permease protein
MRIGRKSGQAGAQRVSLWTAVLVLAICLVFFFAMCIRTGAQTLLPPRVMLHNMLLWVRLWIAELMELPLALQKQELVAASPYYYETVAQFRILVYTMLCGAAIALGGAVFQILFRNPMAAPTMLGVSSGINLGLLVLVVQYSVYAYERITERYLYSLGFAFLMLIIVMAAGRFAGKNRRSVTDMLLVGSVLGQISGAVITFLRFNMEQEEMIVYQNLSMYGFSVNISYDFAGTAILILLGVFLVCMIPLFLMRFSFDTLSFSDDEARVLGVNPGIIRVALIILVTVVVTTAILYCGNVGVLSLVVPHISRYLFGSRFKDLMRGTVLMGVLLLLVCRAVSSLLYLEGMGNFPIGTLAGLLAAPILAMVLSQKRRGWE